MIDQNAIELGIRIRRAEKGAWATIETRLALIAAERGISESSWRNFG